MKKVLTYITTLPDNTAVYKAGKKSKLRYCTLDSKNNPVDLWDSTLYDTAVLRVILNDLESEEEEE